MARKKLERKDLKEELDKEIAVLKTQCKDASFFDRQIDRIMSLKGQVDTDEVRVIVKEDDVLKEYKDKSFYIALTKRAAVFHTFGGYTIVADNRNASSLYLVLQSMMESLLKEGEIDDGEYADVIAKTHILTCPTWCFGDADATYGIASTVIQKLNEMYERLMKEPLQDEDVAANGLFEDAVRGAENIGEIIKSERSEK